MIKVSVEYEHDPADLGDIALAVLPVGTAGPPSEDQWRPAYRDLDDRNRPVVWIKTDQEPGRVWLRDGTGQYSVRPVQ